VHNNTVKNGRVKTVLLLGLIVNTVQKVIVASTVVTITYWTVRERAAKELIAMTLTLASIVPKKARSWVLNVSEDVMHGRMAAQ